MKISRKLKSKKAPGDDGLSAEHFKHAGRKCHEVVALLFNAINVLEYVPSGFKKGIIIPIPKSGKDKSKQDNYRGITLLPVLAKMYQSTLLQKVKVWVRKGNLIEDVQGANQDNCSSLHTNWLVRETISSHLEVGSSIYVCLLDARKAFDTVWQAGLFYQLYESGMEPKLWRLLIELYKEFRCYVRVGSFKSFLVTALQGVHQGAPMSMLKYQLNGNKLLKELLDSDNGVFIGDLCVTCCAFADDTVVMAKSRAELQAKLNIAVSHSNNWRYDYNARKCVVIVFGKDNNPETKLFLGSQELTCIESHEHVGTLLSNSDKQTTNYCKKRITECQRRAHAIPGIGSIEAPVTPTSSSKVYWSVCVPKLTYGMEIMPIPEKAVQSIQSFHADAAKVFQGLPNQTCNIGAVKNMGWLSITGYIAIMQLLFLWRIVLMPIKCIYKIILIKRYCHYMYGYEGATRIGPLSNILQTCKVHGLLDIVKEAIENGAKLSMSEWTKIVKGRIFRYENKLWQSKCLLYPTLIYFHDGLKVNELSPWFRYLNENPQDFRKVRIMTKLLLNVHNLQACQQRYSSHVSNSAICTMCELGCVEDVEHVLFICPRYYKIRETYWNEVCSECPDGLLNDITQMTLRQKCSLFLNGLYVYTPEWLKLYTAIVNFVYYQYMAATSRPHVV